ncbi:MAG: NYN domain-containing protein [Thermomicrobiales bacterium]
MNGDWMMFVDGENLTIRGTKCLQLSGIEPEAGEFYSPGIYLWAPVTDVLRSPEFVDSALPYLSPWGIRAFYYATAPGDAGALSDVSRALRSMKFAPRVFHKQKSKKSKRVDITLATDVLSNAHLGNFDVAVLVAGDEDYLPIVEELQRMGKIVVVSFFEGEAAGLSPNLALAADHFTPLDEYFLSRWRHRLKFQEPLWA